VVRLRGDEKDNGAPKKKNEKHDMAIQKRPHVELMMKWCLKPWMTL
jgi:hypothetical protein